MNADIDFFMEHAGFSYDPQKETAADGHARCARELAEAEALYLQAHRVADMGIEWQPDSECDMRQGVDFEDTCEVAVLWHRKENGSVFWITCLGGIGDATADYRRVVRAELALECSDKLRELIAEGQA